MGMTEYLQRLEALLEDGRLAPHDIEEAVARCRQHILNAGPEREAEVLADMGTPEQLAEEILADYRQRARRSGSGLSTVLKIVVAVFLSPFILAAYGIVLGLVVGGVCCVISGALCGFVGVGALLSGGLGTLLNFLGSGVMTVGIGLLLVLGGVMLCKLFNFCMRRLFGRGGAQA